MEHKKKNTYTSCVFVLSMSIYSTIVDAKARGYMMMPQTEETLAGYLSPGGSSSLKKATLPTKPCRVTSSLVGKAFQAAGQAGAALHTMAVLQACQADLLKDLSTGGSIDEGAFSVRPSRRPVPSAVLWLPGFHGEDICGSTSRASRTKKKHFPPWCPHLTFRPIWRCR